MDGKATIGASFEYLNVFKTAEVARFIRAFRSAVTSLSPLDFLLPLGGIL
jgi:hypothetical protein